MPSPIILNTDGEPVYNAGVDIGEMIDNLPPGLDRAMLRVLSFHVGRENVIGRGKLVREVAKHGFEVHDREARIMINLLRKRGVEICSTGGEYGGYWLASNHEELEEYIQREIESRAMDLHEQASAMRHAAELRWGRYSPEKQIAMF